MGVFPAFFAASIKDGPALAGAYFGWAVALYLLAGGGTLTAALSFGRTEPLRLAWLLLSASYLVLIPQRIVAGPKAAGLYEAAAAPPGWAPSLTSILSGMLAVACFLLLARAWRGSGLDHTSRAGRIGMRLVAFVIAAALAGPDLVEQFPAMLRGEAFAVGEVITDLLDGALFMVAVPVLRAALGLGGGLVAWPWLLLTGSLMAWLGYDATALYGDVAGLDARTVRVVEEVCRTLGAGLAFAGGLAQRWVMTEAD
jgi:hypothetical protein